MNRIWRHAVSYDGEDDYHLSTDSPIRPVIDRYVHKDGAFGRQLLQLQSSSTQSRRGSITSSDGRSEPAASDDGSISPRARLASTLAASFEEADNYSPHPSEDRLARVLELARAERAIAKTVKNDNWTELFDKLTGPLNRTPVTLLPENGQGMRLFCEPRRAAVAVLWDLEEMDLQGAYMWPSGYFAKTEFNLSKDGSLKQGRDAHLVTLDQLRAANRKKEYLNHATGQTEVGGIMPYNEILMPIHGSKGLVGVLARTTKLQHLVLAMGVRDELARLFPELGSLPIVLHDPETGFKAFSLAAQAALVRACLSSESRFFLEWPLDLRVLNQVGIAPDARLTPTEILKFHGRFGVSQDCLSEVAKTTRGEDFHGDAFLSHSRTATFSERAAFALLALEFTVEADNERAARNIVKVVAPLIFEERALRLRSIAGSVAAPEIPSLLPGAVPAAGELVESSITLRNLMQRSGSAGTKISVGAMLALESFHNGRASAKVRSAALLFQEWLVRASSVAFRIQSHKDERRSWSELGNFVSDRIISNRTLFLSTLRELQILSQSRLLFFRSLKELAETLLHPCLRLQVLQGILGLDSSYDRDMVVGVITFVCELVEEMENEASEDAIMAAPEKATSEIAALSATIDAQLQLSLVLADASPQHFAPLDGAMIDHETPVIECH